MVDIENMAQNFYNNTRSSLENRGIENGYHLITSRLNGDRSYFKVGVAIPPVFAKGRPLLNQRKYFQERFDDIVNDYLTSGIEGAARDSGDNITTKVTNSFWRGYKIKVRTPKGKLTIRAHESFWRVFSQIFPIFAPLWHTTNFNIKARFRKYQYREPQDQNNSPPENVQYANAVA